MCDPAPPRGLGWRGWMPLPAPQPTTPTGPWIDLTQEHAAKARQAVKLLPRSLRPIFAALALLPAEVARLQSTRMAPFSAPPEVPDWRKLAAMAWFSWRGA